MPPIFQSTPSVGRATLVLSISSFCFRISIHALRGEGDLAIKVVRKFGIKISIHALRGEGDANALNVSIPWLIFQSTPSVGRATILRAITDEPSESFQSTPSVGRATKINSTCIAEIIISIHALRGEGDFIARTAARKWKNFNPRPPWGGRRPQALVEYNEHGISIHALRGEGDGI